MPDAFESRLGLLPAGTSVPASDVEVRLDPREWLITETEVLNLRAWAVTEGYDPANDYLDTSPPEQPVLPDDYISEHFRQAEFACNHCGQIHPTNPTPPEEVLQWLEQIRAHFGGKPVVVNSGYRCPTHNANVGGAKNSYHMKGQAVDFRVSGVSIAAAYELADKLVGSRGGVGRYKTFVHIDNRGYRSRWNG